MSEKRVPGWGVIRINPWHLAGIFPTEADAVVRKDKLPQGYIIRFGIGFPRSGDFFWNSTEE